jgi:hypothetical protein
MHTCALLSGKRGPPSWLTRRAKSIRLEVPESMEAGVCLARIAALAVICDAFGITSPAERRAIVAQKMSCA